MKDTKLFKRLLKSTRAMINVIMALVATTVSILVGALLLAKIRASIPQPGLPATANNTFSTVESTTYAAFNLAPVILIVMVAAAILGVLYAWTGRGLEPSQ